ncbi:MAG TPA: hypothetical protein VJ742_12330 [Nitrososphaera sp.]|nr:hypothetical protein [Nitrososphaera sp.]
MSTVNRLGNGTFDVNANGWSGNQTAVARTTSTARTGSGSLQITRNAIVANWCQAYVRYFYTAPGITHKFEVYSKAATATRQCQAIIDWFSSNDAGTFITQVQGDLTVNSTSSWTHHEVTGVAPAGASFFSVVFTMWDAELNEVHYIDDAFAYDPDATRLYLPSAGSTAITPGFDSSWESTTSAGRHHAALDPSGTPMADRGQSESSSSSSYDVLWKQYISPPLNGAQTISGSINGAIKSRESNADANMRAQMLVKVVSNDGSTVRGTALAHNTAALTAEEFVTTGTNAKFPFLYPTYGEALTSVNAQDGDRILIEVGYRAHNTTTSSRTGTGRFGDNNSTLNTSNNTYDHYLADTSETADYNPWIEFSQKLNFTMTVASYSSGGVDGGSSMTIDRPFWTDGGDLLIATVAASWSDQPTWEIRTDDEEWIQIKGTSESTSAVETRLVTWYKIAATESETYDFYVHNGSGSDVWMTGHILRIAGGTFNANDPIEASSETNAAESVTGSSHSAISVTTSSPRCLLLAIYAQSEGDIFTTPSYTAPSGMAELAEREDDISNVMVAYNVQISPGASGNKVATSNQSDTGWCAHLVAIKPPLSVNTKTHTTDAHLVKVNTKTHTTDTILKKALTKTHTTDVILKKAITATHSVDTVLQKGLNVTHTTGAVLSKAASKVHTADAYLKVVVSKTHTAGAILKKTLNVTHTSDVVVFKSFSEEHTTDAILSSAFSVTHTVDTSLLVRNTKTHSVGVVLKKNISVIHTVDAVLKHSLTYPHTTDVILRKDNTATHTTDAALKDTFTAFHTVDVSISETFSALHEVDSVLEQLIERFHTVDANLLKFGTLHTVDASVLKAVSRTHTIDSIRKKAIAVIHTVDSGLKKAVTVNHEVEANLFKTVTRTHTADAVLLHTYTAGHTVDVDLFKQVGVAHTTGAVLLERRFTAHLTEALLKKGMGRTHTVGAVLRKTASRTHTVDIVLCKSRQISHTVDTSLVNLQTLVHTTDADLYKAVVKQHTTSVVLKKMGQDLSHTVNADIANLSKRTQIHTVDVTIQDLRWWHFKYIFRRLIKITAPTTGLPSGHPFKVFIPVANTLSQGKIRSDFNDVEVVKFDSVTNTWTAIASKVTRVGSNLMVEAKTTTNIIGTDSNYYVYYGNFNLVDPPSTPSFVEEPWPVKLLNTNLLIGLTRPEQFWKLGISTRRGSRATLEFVGESVRILGDKGPDKAIAEVQIDNGPWIEVDLFAVEEESNVEVYETDLNPGLHRIRYRVAGRRNPASLGDIVKLGSIEYRKPVSIQLQVEETVPNFNWTVTDG